MLAIVTMLYSRSPELIHHKGDTAVQWRKGLSFQELVLGKLDIHMEGKKKKKSVTPSQPYTNRKF